MRKFKTNAGNLWVSPNPYYNPEQCKLWLLAVLEVPNLSYEYDMVIVVKDQKKGGIFAAADSGCSCPTPFENFHGLDDLTPILSVGDFYDFVETWVNGSSHYRFDDVDVAIAAKIIIKQLETEVT